MLILKQPFEILKISLTKLVQLQSNFRSTKNWSRTQEALRGLVGNELAGRNFWREFESLRLRFMLQ